MARGLQGYFIGPMLGTCRIMLQTGFTPQDRAPATRVFLVMILLASALAPMAGGCLVAYFDWRALFMCSTIGGQRFRRLHSSWCRTSANARSSAAVALTCGPYLLFAVALGALQIVAQQLRFEVFSTTPLMPLATVAG